MQGRLFGVVALRKTLFWQEITFSINVNIFSYPCEYPDPKNLVHAPAPETEQGLVVAFESRSVSDMLRISQLPFRLLVSLGGSFLFLEFFFDLKDHTRRVLV
jgi:hypothetical protein